MKYCNNKQFKENTYNVHRMYKWKHPLMKLHKYSGSNLRKDFFEDGFQPKQLKQNTKIYQQNVSHLNVSYIKR
jgi:hypothetical protein